MCTEERIEKLKEVLKRMSPEAAKEVLDKSGLERKPYPYKRTSEKKVIKETRHSHCVVTTVCRHCGVSSVRTVKLARMEKIIVTNLDHTHSTTSAPCVTSYVEHCESCPRYIKNLSRVELEEGYYYYLCNNTRVGSCNSRK